METRTRSILKAVIWTAIGLISMVLVGFLFTGSLTTGGAMAAINASLGFSTYLIYERLWSKITWGLR